jgi:hypothetical protein
MLLRPRGGGHGEPGGGGGRACQLGLPSVAHLLAPHLRRVAASSTVTGIESLHGDDGGGVGDLDGVHQLPPLAVALTLTAAGSVTLRGRAGNGGGAGERSSNDGEVPPAPGMAAAAVAMERSRSWRSWRR